MKDSQNMVDSSIKEPFNYHLTDGLYRLRLLKELRCLSYSQIGQAVGGYTKSYMCLIFKGRYNPPNSTKQKIANFFGVNPLDIWGQK